MPSLWQIPLEIADGATVLPAGVHQMLSEWFLESGEQHVDLKAYSQGMPFRAQGAAVLNLGVVNDALAERLSTLPVGYRYQFGATPAGLAQVAAPPRLMVRLDWHELATGRRPPAGWRLDFHTPTTFRRSGISQPWPDPERVLRSVHQVWMEWGVPEGAEPLPAFQDRWGVGLLVTDAGIATRQCDDAPSSIRGAVGFVEWRLRRPTGEQALHPAFARTVDALLALVPFSGVGAYTQHGLGVTTVRRLMPAVRRP